MSAPRKRMSHATRSKCVAGGNGLWQVQRRTPNGTWVWALPQYFESEEVAEVERAKFDAFWASRKRA